MGFFKKKKKEISKELFGERVLSRMLLTTADQSYSLFEELNVEMTFGNYMFCLEYLLFLTSKILEQQHTFTDVKIITQSAIDGLIIFMDTIPNEKKNEMTVLFREMYNEIEKYANEICGDIGSEQELKNLSKAFLEDCGLQNGMLENLHIFLFFSGFIIHHSSDILNDEIVII